MSTSFRKGVWAVRGYRRYTKQGYEKACKNFKPLDDIDVKGRSFMITGANSGIGKETAMYIAKHGGTVHMVCRDEKRGKEAQDEVKQIANGGEVNLHILDLSQSTDVQKFADQFVKDGNDLHVLVNNAGCMLHKRESDTNGLERNFAVNTLGAYLLTTTFVEHMKKYPDPRIITVTSGGMLLVKLNHDDLALERLQPFDGEMAYAFNKRQQIVLTDDWAKKYPEVGFYTMHPGWADTPAVRTAMPDFHRKMINRLRTPAQGADTLIWLSMSPDVTPSASSGGFFEDRCAVKKHLPWTYTNSSQSEEKSFLEKIEIIANNIRKKAHDDSQSNL